MVEARAAAGKRRIPAQPSNMGCGVRGLLPLAHLRRARRTRIGIAGMPSMTDPSRVVTAAAHRSGVRLCPRAGSKPAARKARGLSCREVGLTARFRLPQTFSGRQPTVRNQSEAVAPVRGLSDRFWPSSEVHRINPSGGSTTHCRHPELLSQQCDRTCRSKTTQIRSSHQGEAALRSIKHYLDTTEDISRFAHIGTVMIIGGDSNFSPSSRRSRPPTGR